MLKAGFPPTLHVHYGQPGAMMEPELRGNPLLETFMTVMEKNESKWTASAKKRHGSSLLTLSLATSHRAARKFNRAGTFVRLPQRWITRDIKMVTRGGPSPFRGERQLNLPPISEVCRCLISGEELDHNLLLPNSQSPPPPSHPGGSPFCLPQFLFP